MWILNSVSLIHVCSTSQGDFSVILFCVHPFLLAIVTIFFLSYPCDVPGTLCDEPKQVQGLWVPYPLSWTAAWGQDHCLRRQSFCTYRVCNEASETYDLWCYQVYTRCYLNISRCFPNLDHIARVLRKALPHLRMILQKCTTFGRCDTHLATFLPSPSNIV